MFRAPSLAVLLCCVGPVAAADKPLAIDLNQNAALKYWQAFSSLPKFTDEQQKLLDEYKPGDPVGNTLKEIVALSEDALRELHHAAKVPQCAWGVSYQDGVSTRLNHCVG